MAGPTIPNGMTTALSNDFSMRPSLRFQLMRMEPPPQAQARAHKEHAMTTIIKLLKVKLSRRQHTQVDDYLLCDIGVSRIVFEYQGS
jgi:hypothetical protein